MNFTKVEEKERNNLNFTWEEGKGKNGLDQKPTNFVAQIWRGIAERRRRLNKWKNSPFEHVRGSLLLFLSF